MEQKTLTRGNYLNGISRTLTKFNSTIQSEKNAKMVIEVSWGLEQGITELELSSLNKEEDMTIRLIIELLAKRYDKLFKDLK